MEAAGGGGPSLCVTAACHVTGHCRAHGRACVAEWMLEAEAPPGQGLSHSSLGLQQAKGHESFSGQRSGKPEDSQPLKNPI